MAAGLTAGNIVWATTMGRLVPRELMGRVFSLDWLVSVSLVPLSYGLAGPIAAAIGTKATLLGGGLLACASVLAVFFGVPKAREADRRAVEPAQPDYSPTAASRSSAGARSQ
jgi:hypothetical protein